MCDVGIFCVNMVRTFNLLSLMLWHILVMLQINNLLIAGAVEIIFVSYNGKMLYKEVVR